MAVTFCFIFIFFVHIISQNFAVLMLIHIIPMWNSVCVCVFFFPSSRNRFQHNSVCKKSWAWTPNGYIWARTGKYTGCFTWFAVLGNLKGKIETFEMPWTIEHTEDWKGCVFFLRTGNQSLFSFGLFFSHLVCCSCCLLTKSCLVY